MITFLLAILLPYKNFLVFLNVCPVGARKSPLLRGRGETFFHAARVVSFCVARSFGRLFVRSFVPSLVRFFVRSSVFVLLYAPSFVPLVLAFVSLFIVCLFVYLCICLFVYQMICFVPEDTDVILLFANRRDIRRIKLGSEFPVYGQVVTGQRGAVAIDYDYDTGFIYWTDVTLGNIQRALIDDSRTIEVVVRGLKSPEGLAVDWINKRLYWTDGGADVIEVAEFNGRHRMALITTGLGNPRAIVVHPVSG